MKIPVVNGMSVENPELLKQEDGQKKLAKMIEKWTGEKHSAETPIPGLVLHQWPTPTEPTSYMFTPHLCLIAQGVKRILLGEEAYVYDAHSFVVSSVELPVISQVLEASPEKPYLGLTLELDLKEISRLMLHGELPSDASGPTGRGIGVGKLPPSLLNAVERLLELLDSPAEIPLFLPLIRQEIYYRLLMNDHGDRLRQMVRAESRSWQIARAIDWLKANFDQPLSINELARYAGMSPSGFHQHFRALTAISPLQFQKRIRLNEARRLMLLESMDAGTASFRVGYESPTQFNREYKRMFGNPPRADIKNLQTVEPVK